MDIDNTVVRKVFSPKPKSPEHSILRIDFQALELTVALTNYRSEAAHPITKNGIAFLSTIPVLSVDFQKCVVFSTDISHNPKVVFKIDLFLTTLDDISAKHTA